MTKVVDLETYRTKAVEERGFSAWRNRFGQSYGAKTRLADLSDSTLYFLALPGEETAGAFYELIMGVLGLGEAPRFYYLSNADQMRVVDIHFFLADQVRFEMMHRLGWVSSRDMSVLSDFAIIRSAGGHGHSVSIVRRHWVGKMDVDS